MRQKDTEDGEDAEKNDRKGDTDAEGEEKEAGERIWLGLWTLPKEIDVRRI